jgi:hypothetical protein
MVLESVATAVITVIIGVLVYGSSQIVSKFAIEPVHKHDEIRGEIAHSLAYFADAYANPGLGTPKHGEASAKLREQACLLGSRTLLIRKYSVYSSLGLVPSRQKIQKACANLIGISNQVNTPGTGTQNVQWAEETKQWLRL